MKSKAFIAFLLILLGAGGVDEARAAGLAEKCVKWFEGFFRNDRQQTWANAAEQAHELYVELRAQLPGTTETRDLEKYISQDHHSVVSSVGPDHQLQAKLEYEVGHGVVGIIDVWTAPALYRQGYSTMLLAKVIETHPEIDVLGFSLGQENLRAYQDAVRAGKSTLDAIRETPAYKASQKLGFTEIDTSGSRIAGPIVGFKIRRPVSRRPSSSSSRAGH